MATETITLSNDYITVLNNQERLSGFTHKFTIPYTELNRLTTLSGTTDVGTVNLAATLPADWMVTKAAINVTTAFAGTGGLAIEVGTDGDPNNFITSTSVLTAAPTITLAGAAPTTLAGSFAAASDVLCATFTNSVSGSIAAASAGSVDIFLGIWSLNELG